MPSHSTKAGRLRRFARTLLPWLAGLSVWWLVGSWLGPHPRWRLTFSPGTPYLEPVCEDASGAWIVAWESTSLRGSLNDPRTLVVFNAHAPRERYELPNVVACIVDNPRFARPELYAPRFHAGLVWRVTEMVTNDGAALELRAWNFRQGKTEAVVRRWTSSRAEPVQLSWFTGGNGRLLEQRALPWWDSFLIATEPATRLVSLTAFAALGAAGQGVLASPTLCQAWQLPEAVNDSLRPLGRWFLAHAQSWSTAVTTADGRVAAFTSPLLSEVVWYDVESGRQKGRFVHPRQAPCVLQPLGPYVLIRPKNPNHLLELKANNDLVLLDLRTGRQILWPEDFRVSDTAVSLASHPDHGHLLFLVARGTGEFSPTQEMKCFIIRSLPGGGRMGLFRNLSIPPVTPGAAGDRGWRLFGWLLTVNETGEAVPGWLLTLARIHPSVENWVRSFWPNAEFRVSLLELGDRDVLWQRRHAIMLPGRDGAFRQLMLVGLDCRADGQHVPTFLEYWDLPLELYSPWWSRGAGLGAGLLVLFCFWIAAWRWRRRRSLV